MSCFLDFPADGGHEDGHQGTDEVEETVGEICEGGDAEDGGLRHAACVPGNEYGGDGGRILAGTAQQPQFITLFLIGFLVHVAGEYDGNKLVTGGDVEKEARKNGACHQTQAVVDKTDDNARDALDHSAGHHDSSEAHGTDNQPDGVEHTGHSAGRNQFIE